MAQALTWFGMIEDAYQKHLIEQWERSRWLTGIEVRLGLVVPHECWCCQYDENQAMLIETGGVWWCRQCKMGDCRMCCRDA